jgi:hypothetical protein
MAHTNSTDNYALPQYVGGDKINPLTDTNGAYRTIDTTMFDFEERIDALEQATPSAETTTITAKGLTFNFYKIGNNCYVNVNGTLTADIEDNTVWTGVTVPTGYIPAIATASVPIVPNDIYNDLLAIKFNTNGAISSDCVTTIPSGATINCKMVYPISD